MKIIKNIINHTTSFYLKNENKLFKSKRAITKWLDKYGIKNYSLHESTQYGYVVNVHSDVYLNGQALTAIKVKFISVNGDFFIQNNELTTLTGAPQYVKGNFDCSDNKITTLQDGPISVQGFFSCENNQLNNLKGRPKKVSYEFYFKNNPVTPQLRALQKTINFKFLEPQIQSIEDAEHLRNVIICTSRRKNIHKI